MAKVDRVGHRAGDILTVAGIMAGACKEYTTEEVCKEARHNSKF